MRLVAEATKPAAGQGQLVCNGRQTAGAQSLRSLSPCWVFVVTNLGHREHGRASSSRRKRGRQASDTAAASRLDDYAQARREPRPQIHRKAGRQTGYVNSDGGIRPAAGHDTVYRVSQEQWPTRQLDKSSSVNQPRLRGLQFVKNSARRPRTKRAAMGGCVLT